MKGQKKDRQSGCPIAFTLDILGDKWTLLIVRDMMFRGKRHYGEFLDSPEGIATNILADRLARLEAEGVVSKNDDPDHQAKYVYTLTEKGLALLPLLLEVVLWGAKHDPDTAAPKEFVQWIKKDRNAVIKETLARLKNNRKG
jgi:DNA-binding HxlR family transcriptional regulator